MPINIKDTTIETGYVGNKNIYKIYLDSVEVFPSPTPIRSPRNLFVSSTTKTEPFYINPPLNISGLDSGQLQVVMNITPTDVGTGLQQLLKLHAPNGYTFNMFIRNLGEYPFTGSYSGGYIVYNRENSDLYPDLSRTGEKITYGANNKIGFYYDANTSHLISTWEEAYSTTSQFYNIKLNEQDFGDGGFTYQEVAGAESEEYDNFSGTVHYFKAIDRIVDGDTGYLSLF